MTNRKKPWIKPEVARIESSAGLRRAMSYGPFGVIRSVLLGFVIGNVIFLVIRASIKTEESLRAPSADLSLYAACALGCALIALVAASIANALIGNRIRKAIEMQRELFSNGELPPAFPRPDGPGYDLQARRQSQAQASAPERKANIA